METKELEKKLFRRSIESLIKIRESGTLNLIRVSGILILIEELLNEQQK